MKKTDQEEIKRQYNLYKSDIQLFNSKLRKIDSSSAMSIDMFLFISEELIARREGKINFLRKRIELEEKTAAMRISKLEKENEIMRDALFKIEYEKSGLHNKESGLLRSQEIAIDAKTDLIKLRNL